MIKCEKNKIFRRCDKEVLCIEAWGENGLRVRATQRHEFTPDDISALLKPGECVANIEQDETHTIIENGKIQCLISNSGKLSFLDQNGKKLLEEYERNRNMGEEGRKEFNSALEIEPRAFSPIQGTDNFKLVVRFEAEQGEKIYGMGQYQQPCLDVKGCILELAHRNSQASVPFALSNRGYGILWNTPSIGNVVFGKNLTMWTAESTKQMDYWITAGDTPAEIVENYANVTGKVPMMPEYGLGFWQSRLRYQTQEEVLQTAKEYKKRELPLDVLVIDFFHWPHEGDWRFDTEYWPDPSDMTRQLKEMGVETMVSIWPTVERESDHYREMEEKGYLVRSEHGKRLGQLGDSCMIDVTNPKGRDFVWNKIRENYYKNGIHNFWLDEAEPELTGYEYCHYRYFRGAAMEVGNIYPREYARMVYEGMKAEGKENIVSLLRCAWAGSQKYGALVWSGDIDSSFEALRNQLAAGLNMGIAGIPWWTTDIGGFHSGNIYDRKFHELLVRWFEFGTFCPVMRLHGFREPFQKPIGDSGGGKVASGASNEVWSYGEDVYNICKKFMMIREGMKPYIRSLMQQAHEKGTPIMRPLFYDYPEEEEAWNVEDQYMFGPDLLVAPILYESMTKREVYLPRGKWWNVSDRSYYSGESRIIVTAPLEVIPVFVRAGTLEKSEIWAGCNKDI